MNGRSKHSVPKRSPREKPLKLMHTHRLSNTYHGSAGQRLENWRWTLEIWIRYFSYKRWPENLWTISRVYVTVGQSSEVLKSWSVLPILFRKDTWIFLESAIYLSMWPDVLKILGNVHLACICFSSILFLNCSLKSPCHQSNQNYCSPLQDYSAKDWLPFNCDSRFRFQNRK